MQPAIKWSGSKRPIAKKLVSLIPSDIDTYYEPFCGSCAVLVQYLLSKHEANSYVCSDLNKDLIDLWNSIKNTPEIVCEHYETLWHLFNTPPDIEHRKKVFFDIRNEYNKTHNPLDFMFIMRTTTNGMPRYNSNGLFNNSCHFSRSGIEPKKLKSVVNKWSNILEKYDVKFIQCSYSHIKPTKFDFMFLDPPYANTKGMYFNNFDNNALWDYIRGIQCGYILTYDGISGNIDNTYAVPTDLYDGHTYVNSGNSSFKRVIGNSKGSYVHESVYWKYNKP